jgi:hypothetical protein
LGARTLSRTRRLDLFTDLRRLLSMALGEPRWRREPRALPGLGAAPKARELAGEEHSEKNVTTSSVVPNGRGVSVYVPHSFASRSWLGAGLLEGGASMYS